VALPAAGFVELGLGANWLTAGLGLFTLLSYLLLHTPLKSRTPHSTSVGAIPGAMPPLMGYAAMHGALTAEAWTLHAILFLWQFPHFLSIAWMYREDYARGGIRMLPVVAPDGESTPRAILISAALLVPVSLLPGALAMTGKLHLVGATRCWARRSTR
jgi:protoheme IX farnesyltransferase